MKLFKSGHKGFTLIELLVVIAILGTLAGVVVLNVIQFIGRGACEAASTEYHNIQTAAVAAAYEAGTAAGVTWTETDPFLLTTPKYNWSAAVTAGLVDYTLATAGPSGDPWPTGCTP